MDDAVRKLAGATGARTKMSDGAMHNSLKALLRQLTPRRKRQLILLLILTLLGATAELLSLGAVVPFVTVLANPAAAARNSTIAALMTGLNIESSQLPMAVSVIFAGLVLVATCVRLVLLWANIRFANGLGAQIGETLYARTLQRPYSFHVSRNSSEIIGSINKVRGLIVGYVQPLLTGISALVLAISIIALLVIVNPAVALGGATIFGGSYFLVALLVRKQLRSNGVIVAITNDQRIQALQEGLGGIRDVILDHAQPIYIRRFSRIEQQFRRAQASSQFTSMFPRVAIEAIGILLLVGFAFAMNRSGHDLTIMLPILGLLAIGAQKLVPLFQQIYAGWSSVTNNQRSVDDVLALLDFEPLPESVETIAFRHNIQLRGVDFRYGESDAAPVLNELDLQISRGEKIGVVGPTGSGKSTLVDLLMGLLSPTGGQFTIDGLEITPANSVAWQRHIAHVPQSIYLSDASIAENIAFGTELRKIDLARVEAAARAAQIHDHVEKLDKGYLTHVGERGVRLSGGQRQRIGIARALYKGVDVLVLDEATSALDDDTEQRVMSGISEIATGMTVIMIAHRLTTMRDCDRILRLDKGRITQILTFDELISGDAVSASFHSADPVDP
jgi:ATP-binding cassette, subfamily B, bacterial PglK